MKGSLTFHAVVECVLDRRRHVSAHALAEAEADRLSLQEIELATCTGECIEDYSDDPRGPSCLVLGRVGGRAVHAVWGYDAQSRRAILITVYLPDPQRWSDDLRRRRARHGGDVE